MQGCAGTPGTVCNMGRRHRRRSSDTDSMYIGAPPKQENNEARPGKTGAEAMPVNSDCVGCPVDITRECDKPVRGSL